MDFQVKIFDDSAPILKDSTCLIGLESYGNIGQLTIDCLLATLARQQRLQSVGTIYSTYLYPMTGYESFEDEESVFLCRPLEIYKVINEAFYILIQRSPCFPKKTSLFVEALIQWIQSISASQVIYITGASMEDIELSGPQRLFHYIPSTLTHIRTEEEEEEEEELLSMYPSLKSLLQESCILNLPNERRREYNENETSFVIYSGDIFSRAPYGMQTIKEIIKQTENLKASTVTATATVTEMDHFGQTRFLVIGKFVNEGENTIDGIDLAAKLMVVFGLSSMIQHPSLLNIPLSWRKRILSNENQDLYT